MGFIDNLRQWTSEQFDKITDQQNTYHRSSGKTQKEFENDLKTYKALETGLIADAVLSAAGLGAALAPGAAAAAKGAGSALGQAGIHLSRAAGSAAAAKSAAAAGNAALAGQAATNAARNIAAAKIAGMGVGDAFLGLAPALTGAGAVIAPIAGGVLGAGTAGAAIANASKNDNSNTNANNTSSVTSQSDKSEEDLANGQGGDTYAVEQKDVEETKSPEYDIDEMAGEFILGAWGNGQDRIDNMINAGYTIDDYNAIQQRVNDAYASGRDLHEWTNKANAKLHYW